MATNPTAFISYSWDDDVHKNWVREFAARLRKDGVDATLDQWTLAPGDRLPLFMERAVQENRYVIIVCSPNYKEKSDSRKGGVGYEGDIMTAEVYAKGNHEKFIPVLRRGDLGTSVPKWLTGKYSIDLSTDPYSEIAYLDLLKTLHNRREKAPPIGTVPKLIVQSRPIGIEVSHSSQTEEPLNTESAIVSFLSNTASDRERLEHLITQKERHRKADVENQKIRQIEDARHKAEVLASEKAKTQEVLTYCKQTFEGFRLVPTRHEIHVDSSSCSVLHALEPDEIEYVCLNISHWSRETGDFQGLIPILLTRFRHGEYQIINAVGERTQYKTFDDLTKGLVALVSDMDSELMAKVFANVRSRLARR